MKIFFKLKGCQRVTWVSWHIKQLRQRSYHNIDSKVKITRIALFLLLTVVKNVVKLRYKVKS